MSALVITAANVKPSAAASLRQNIAGVAITAGQLVYKDANGKMQLSDSNAGDASSAVHGVAVASAAADQPVAWVDSDSALTIGATVVKGTTYCLGATAGSIVPQADLITADRVIVVGIAPDTAKLNLHIWDSGVVL